MPRQKQPQFVPQIGSRVRKRGGACVGTVVSISPRFPAWLDIAWDDGTMPKVRPLVCHRAEMEEAEPS